MVGDEWPVGLSHPYPSLQSIVWKLEIKAGNIVFSDEREANVYAWPLKFTDEDSEEYDSGQY